MNNRVSKEKGEMLGLAERVFGYSIDYSIDGRRGLVTRAVMKVGVAQLVIATEDDTSSLAFFDTLLPLFTKKYSRITRHYENYLGFIRDKVLPLLEPVAPEKDIDGFDVMALGHYIAVYPFYHAFVTYVNQGAPREEEVLDRFATLGRVLVPLNMYAGGIAGTSAATTVYAMLRDAIKEGLIKKK